MEFLSILTSVCIHPQVFLIAFLRFLSFFLPVCFYFHVFVSFYLFMFFIHFIVPYKSVLFSNYRQKVGGTEWEDSW